MRSTMYLLFSLFIVLIVGCTPEPTPIPSPIPPTATPEPTAIPTTTTCLVTDVGSVTDGGFNQYAFEGLTEVVSDYNMNEIIIRQSDSEADYEPNIASCLDAGADAIVIVGFLLQEASINAARENPDVYFIGVDQDATSIDNAPENYVGVQFREDQAGFLVGALAAIVANNNDSDVIAGIYGIDVPAVKRFRNGFEQGALYINPEWELGTNILGNYENSFIDADIGIAAAQTYIAQDASVIFGAGGPMSQAGIAYAAEQGVYVIGVDQDVFYTTFDSGAAEGTEFLISSALKRVDQGVYDMISVLAEGRYDDFPGGQNYILDATRGGVGFAQKHRADIPDDVYQQVSEVLALLRKDELSTNVDFNTGELIEDDSDESES